jgi:NAD(P)-dependent dehydrogenase (short-subunit alcohol dehydrogenase family)
MQLENKVATGASSGTHNAVALAFAEEGAAIVVDYRGHSQAEQDLVEHTNNIAPDAVSTPTGWRSCSQGQRWDELASPKR